MMNEQQKAAIRAALPFCRDRLDLPKKGGLDYEEAARQIAALPDAQHIRDVVAWVLGYEAGEKAFPPPTPSEYVKIRDA